MNAILKYVFLHTLFLGGMLALFYWFLLMPQKELLTGLNQDVKKKVVEIEEGLSGLESIDGGNEKFSRLQEEVASLRMRFVSWGSVEEIGLELAKWAGGAGFELVRVIPPLQREGVEVEIYSDSEIRIVELPLVLEIRGDYQRFGQLLQSREGFPFHITPGRMTMSSDEPGKARVTIVTELKIYVIEGDPQYEI